MSSPVSLADFRQTSGRSGQMSQANRFGGRAAVRAVRVLPVVDREGFLVWWAGVMRRRCGADAVEISRVFAVTEQTGRNWLAEFSCPLAHHMDLACQLWPEEFAARYGVGADLQAVA